MSHFVLIAVAFKPNQIYKGVFEERTGAIVRSYGLCLKPVDSNQAGDKGRILRERGFENNACLHFELVSSQERDVADNLISPWEVDGEWPSSVKQFLQILEKFATDLSADQSVLKFKFIFSEGHDTDYPELRPVKMLFLSALLEKFREEDRVPSIQVVFDSF